GPQRDDKTGFGTYPRRPTARILLSLVASGRSVDVSPTLRLHAERDLAYWGIRQVVVGPAPHEPVVLDFLTTLLRRPPEYVEGVWLWRDVTPRQVAP
ncbi:MAG: hypothetical protein WCD35_16515, partial [Mycobacteriales bacterium]